MLLSAGVNKLVVLAFVPEDKTSQVSAKEWVEAALKSVGGTLVDGATESSAQAEVAGDASANKFPIKMKDTARADAFAYLRSKGAIEEDDESEEEMYGLDY